MNKDELTKKQWQELNDLEQDSFKLNGCQGIIATLAEAIPNNNQSSALWLVSDTINEYIAKLDDRIPMLMYLAKEIRDCKEPVKDFPVKKKAKK